MNHDLYLLCKSNEISYVLTCRSVNNIVYILYKVFTTIHHNIMNLLIYYLKTVHCTVYSYNYFNTNNYKNIFNKSYFYSIILITTFK